MYFPLTSWSLLLHSFIASQGASAAYVEKRDNAAVHEAQARFRHEAEPIFRRRQHLPRAAQAGVAALVTPPPDAGVLTYITPSPSASPIAVTRQSQVVESFVPVVTFCAPPPLILISGSLVNTATRGPYLNVSQPRSTGTSNCVASYSPTLTTVCATVLTALASKVTITSCDQNVTFSSQLGYTVEVPSSPSDAFGISSLATPTIRDLTSYYVASWQDLAATPGVAPQDVDLRICSTYANGSTICEVQYQEWRVGVATVTTTTTSTVDVTATYPGPGEIVVHTQHWSVVDTITTFSLTSTFDVETSIEVQSTSTGLRVADGLGTRTNTLTVVYNTDSAEPTWTTTAFTTETTYDGTSTAVVPASS